MRSFGRATRDLYRDLREGPIHIYVDVKTSLFSIIVVIFGTVVRGIVDAYSNEGKVFQERGCPVLDGQFYNWLFNLGNLLIVIGFLGLSVSGIIPKMFHLCQMPDEAICCGQVFMSAIGKFIVFIAFFSVVFFNIYGSFILGEAQSQGIQSESSWPKEKAKKFCHKVVIDLFKIANYGVYTLIGICVLGAIITCLMAIRKYAKKGMESSSSVTVLSMEEEKFLKVLGYEFSDSQKRKNKV